MSVAANMSRSQGVTFYRTLGRWVRRSPMQVREAVWGLLMISPWLLGLIVFVLGPIIACIYLSLTDYEVLGTANFIGLNNYAKALDLGKIIPAFADIRGDRLTYLAMGKTLIYAIITVPIGTVGSLLVAMLLNQRLHGTYFFRTLFFIPQLIPGIVSAMLWKVFMNPTVGILNAALAAVGLPTSGWYLEPKSAMMSVVIIGLWGSIGGSRMIIFLAGLQGVPVELSEAAELDGASAWSRFWNVTLPMISPTVLFNVILGVIGALQVFTVAFAATQGGPSYATWFFALHIYRQAFDFFRMGYASALAWIFAVGLLIFTWLQWRASDRFVFYAGESA